MSLRILNKESFEGLLILIILAGILTIIGSLCALIIGTWLNPSWLSQGILLIIPFLIVGFVVIGISSKLLEILK